MHLLFNDYSFRSFRTSLFVCFSCITFLNASSNKNVTTVAQQGVKHVFIENKGQLNNKVLFATEINGGELYLEKNSFTYNFYNTEDWENFNECIHSKDCQGYNVRAHAYKMNLINANQNPVMVGLDKQATYHNYFIGKDRSRWASQVSLYKEIVYQNIYDHIDLRVYAENASIKYDFIVQPGGNPDDIILQYEGLEQINIIHKDLKLTTSVNEIVESMPRVYQQSGSVENSISCSYMLEGQTVKFNITENYNASLPLIIDPQVIISTYSGSTSGFEGVCATYGENGTLYASGAKVGLGYPVTVGAYQTTDINADIAISKYDSTGANLLYATFIGGTNHPLVHEYPSVMRIDDGNNLFMMGTTSAPDYPTTSNAYDTSFNSIPGSGLDSLLDIVISKLSSDGSTLLASTYIGGIANDGLSLAVQGSFFKEFRYSELIIDNYQDIYFVSSTASGDFPTVNALQSNLDGLSDGCIFKMNADLDTLYWSTFLGGSQHDGVYSINFTYDSILTITGSTGSNDFPYVSSYAYKATYSGNGDAFVIKMDRNGNNVIHGTFLGTNQGDAAYFTDFDGENNLYVLGVSKGSYLVSPCKYSMENGSVFIDKLNDSLSNSYYSTVIGEAGTSPIAFMVDSCSMMYIITSVGFEGGNIILPVTSNAFQPDLSGVEDFYICVLDNNAKGLNYGSFLGGEGEVTANLFEEHTDGGISRFKKNEKTLYMAGCTGSSSFPTNIDDYGPTNLVTNFWNGFGFKMDMSDLVNQWELDPTISVNPSNAGCRPFNTSFISDHCGYTTNWYFGTGDSILDNNTPDYIYDTNGVFNVTAILIDTMPNICKVVDTAYLSISVQGFIDVSIVASDSIICAGDSASLLGSGADNFVWKPEEYLSNTDSSSTFAFPLSTTTYTLIGSRAGCDDDSAFFTLLVNNLPTGVCCDDTIISGSSTILSGSADNTYVWSPTNGLSCTDCASPEASPDSTTTYYVTIINSNGCEIIDTITVYVINEQLAIPSVFSPNNDGLNDVFVVFNDGISEVLDYKIYNRWGDIVFESTNINSFWDGTYQNELQEIGVYYYVLNAKGITGEFYSKEGAVTLLR